MESDSEAPDDSVVDPDYSIEVYTEEDDIDIDDDDDDDSPGEDTSRKKARTEIQQFQQERIAAEQARIQALDITQSHELLLTCLERDPSMLFDLMAHSQVQDDSQIIRTPGQPEWCVCGRCR
ncbi:unnamed protein product [Gadus morhua 'NCC']